MVLPPLRLRHDPVRGGAAPACLTALAATPAATWDGLGAGDKTPIREALVRDQGALCAYCQRRIVVAEDPATGRSLMKIEHWHARATYPQHQLRWTNLLGVCVGGATGLPDGAAGRVAVHCDVSRGKAALFLHPVDGQGADPGDHLRYDKAGKVEPAKRDARVEGDIVALNLNAPGLRRARREIFDEIWRRLEQEGFSLQALRRVARMHRLIPGTQAPEHAAFVRYHVLKKLKQRGESE